MILLTLLFLCENFLLLRITTANTCTYMYKLLLYSMFLLFSCGVPSWAKRSVPVTSALHVYAHFFATYPTQAPPALLVSYGYNPTCHTIRWSWPLYSPVICAAPCQQQKMTVCTLNNVLKRLGPLWVLEDNRQSDVINPFNDSIDLSICLLIDWLILWHITTV